MQNPSVSTPIKSTEQEEFIRTLRTKLDELPREQRIRGIFYLDDIIELENGYNVANIVTQKVTVLSKHDIESVISKDGFQIGKAMFKEYIEPIGNYGFVRVPLKEIKTYSKQHIQKMSIVFQLLIDLFPEYRDSIRSTDGKYLWVGEKEDLERNLDEGNLRG